jgi:hypothetical protein
MNATTSNTAASRDQADIGLNESPADHITTLVIFWCPRTNLPRALSIKAIDARVHEENLSG